MNGMKTANRIVLRTGLLAIALSLGASTSARAQGYIIPFIGYNFGGDSGSACLTITNCQDKKLNVGLTLGSAGTLIGFEEEFGYAKNFYGEVPGVKNSVLTLMTNLMVGPKIGFVRPYAVAGLGFMRAHADLSTGSLLSITDNAFGWDLGGGLMITGGHVGLRGDIRYFHAFQDLTLAGISVSSTKLDFGRASAGLVLQF
jgi:opacity protein-like surface antigen